MNTTTGLLRVLAPDIAGFIGATLLIVIVMLLANRFIGAVGRANKDLSHADISLSQRSVRRVALALWLVVGAGLAWHASIVAFSLRIPRSDVDPSGVYLRMDQNERGPTR